MKWTKHGLIFTLEHTSDWRNSHAQLPIVDTMDRDRWRIYYSSRNSEGQSLPCYLDVEPGDPANIIRDVAGPLLELGQSGRFDQHGIMPTAIADDGERKLLYYIGWSQQQDVPYRNAIGLATSDDDGNSYRKYSGEPVIGRSDIDTEFTGTFNVLRVGEQWHGYYMSCTEWRDCDGKLEPCYLLKYASSDNGIDWKRDGRIAIDYREGTEGGIVAASVLPFQDAYRMWYCHRQDCDYRSNPHNSYRIGYAESADAVNWQRMDDEANIDVSGSGWDSQMICYPNVVRYQDRLFMFYNGNGFGQSGIGFATCEPDERA